MGEPMLGLCDRFSEQFVKAVRRTVAERYLPTRAIPRLPGFSALNAPERSNDVQALREALELQTKTRMYKYETDDESDAEVDAQLRRSASENAPAKEEPESKAAAPPKKGIFGDDGDFDLEEASDFDASDYRALRDSLSPALVKIEQKRELLESTFNSLSQAVTYCKNSGKKQRDHHSKVLRILDTLTKRCTKIVAVKRRKSTMARDVYCVIKARLREERRLKKEVEQCKTRIQALKRKLGNTKATEKVVLVKAEGDEDQSSNSQDAVAGKALREQWLTMEEELRKFFASGDLSSAHPAVVKEEAKSPERKRSRRRKKNESTDGEECDDGFPEESESLSAAAPNNGKSKKKTRSDHPNRAVTLGTTARRAVSMDMGVPLIISPLSMEPDRASAAVVWGNKDGLHLKVYPGCGPTGGIPLSIEKARARTWRTIAHDVRSHRREEELVMVEILDRLHRERKRWNTFVEQAQVLRRCAPEGNSESSSSSKMPDSEERGMGNEKVANHAVSALEALSQVSASAANLETSSDASESCDTKHPTRSSNGRANQKTRSDWNPKPVIESTYETPWSSESEWGELSRENSESLTRSTSTGSRNGNKRRVTDSEREQQDGNSQGFLTDSTRQSQKAANVQKRKVKRRRR